MNVCHNVVEKECKKCKWKLRQIRRNTFYNHSIENYTYE